MLITYLKKWIQVFLPKEKPHAEIKITPREVNEVASASKFNIVTFAGDAIVNAANQQLAPGGGVCGHIFAASDFDALEQACAEQAPCPTGSARITPSFGLNAPWIIHAVGPIYDASNQERCAQQLHDAYYETLTLAEKHQIKSIAFPAISTGIYGYPLNDATNIAVEAVRKFVIDHPETKLKVHFSCFDDKTYDCYQTYLNNAASVVKQQELQYD